MMGAESVAYHRATVLERGDDHPGQALAYYATRGETPLVWGGTGSSLGLSGAVDPESMRRSSDPVVPEIRGRVSGWSGPGGRGWSWSSPPTSRSRNWG